MTSDADEFDAYQYVPDRIDAITASGIEEMYANLDAVNRARCRDEEIEVVAHIFWELVEQGTIDPEVQG